MLLVDQFGNLHAPFAQARAFLTEHGFGDTKVVVHGEDGRVVVLRAKGNKTSPIHPYCNFRCKLLLRLPCRFRCTFHGLSRPFTPRFSAPSLHLSLYIPVYLASEYFAVSLICIPNPDDVICCPFPGRTCASGNHLQLMKLSAGQLGGFSLVCSGDCGLRLLSTLVYDLLYLYFPCTWWPVVCSRDFGEAGGGFRHVVGRQV